MMREHSVWHLRNTLRDLCHHMKRCLERSQVPRCTHHWKGGTTLSWMPLSSLMLMGYSNISHWLAQCNGLAISLGHFDIATAVMSMSSFWAAPHWGHLKWLQRICGYLVRMKHATLRFQVHQPDYSDLPVKQYDWLSTYGEISELLPDNAPNTWQACHIDTLCRIPAYFMMHWLEC